MNLTPDDLDAIRKALQVTSNTRLSDLRCDLDGTIGELLDFQKRVDSLLERLSTDVATRVFGPDPDAPSRRLDAFQADINNLNITGREVSSSSGPAAPTAG